jgi:hypothetical protein
LGGEIDAYQRGATQYMSVLYTSPDINEAKKMLDEYISLTKQCLTKENFNKKEYEDFDKGLGKDFGTVSYEAYYTKDNFPYVLKISLGQHPQKGYIVLYLFRLEYDESNY